MVEAVKHLISMFRHGMPCMFHEVTGLYCPGCGGTRACMYLLHGNILRSLQYHPLVPYVAFVVLLEVGSYLLSRLLHRPGIFVKRYVMFTYIGVGIVILNWIWKNYSLVVLGVDLLP